jgi:hypothetical protein
MSVAVVGFVVLGLSLPMLLMVVLEHVLKIKSKSRDRSIIEETFESLLRLLPKAFLSKKRFRISAKMLPRHTHSQRLRLLESCRLFEGSLARQFPTEHQSLMRVQRDFIRILRCAIDVCLVLLKHAAFIAANQLLAFPQ